MIHAEKERIVENFITDVGLGSFQVGKFDLRFKQQVLMNTQATHFRDLG